MPFYVHTDRVEERSVERREVLGGEKSQLQTYLSFSCVRLFLPDLVLRSPFCGHTGTVPAHPGEMCGEK